VQVERIAERGSLNPRQVQVPGVLVDCVVVADRPEHHMQTYSEPYNPAFAGEIRVPMSAHQPMPMSERKIIARRAALELQSDAVVNLGIGMPEGVATVAAEERVIDLLTLTAEPGVIGGIPAGGLSFGAAVNTQAIIDQPSQFDFYDGGGLDIAFLGLAQADREGNLNVRSSAAPGRGRRLHQHLAERQAGGLRRAPSPRVRWRLRWRRPAAIVREGPGAQVRRCGRAPQLQRPAGGASGAAGAVRYRALRVPPVRGGLALIEIAPGIDLQRDILARMDFVPVMKRPPALMDARIFADAPMGLRHDLLNVPLERRLAYDAQQDVFFVDFEGLSVRTPQDIAAIRDAVRAALAPLGRKVDAVVNYDRFSIVPELVDDYVEMVKGLMDAHYHTVTRYTANGFLRMKLGEELEKRRIPAHFYASASEAWRRLETP
jgi:propionate CoA-transferase